MVATYDPDRDQCEIMLCFPHPVTDVCPAPEGLWLIAGGGSLGRRVILWSLEQNSGLREFDCPDGAAAGMALDGDNLWLTHRRNRKLFCMDSNDGRIRWLIRTGKENFSPDVYNGNLWLIECDPGPLAHWSPAGRARYSFIRFDTARERIVERIYVPFTPGCMTFDGKRFWYTEPDEKGFRSVTRESLTKTPSG